MQSLILLIDDDPEEFEILKEALLQSKVAASCIWARGVEHAIRTLQQVVPDYIFIDINMPGMDGFTCLQELKKNDQLAGTPMVIYSTAVDDAICVKAVEQGATCCIQKPDNLDTLVKHLVKFLTVNNTENSYSKA